MTIDESVALSEIGGIPWESLPFAGPSAVRGAAYAPEDSAERNPLPPEGRLPIGSGKPIAYGDDVWDFNKAISEINSSTYKIVFAGMPPELKRICKNYVLLSLLERRLKIPTLGGIVHHFSRLMREVEAETGKGAIELVTEEDIRKAIGSFEISSSASRRYFTDAWHILSYAEAHEGAVLPLDTEALREEGRRLRKLSAPADDKRKTQNIPEELYSSILRMAIDVMEDPEAPRNERITAATLVILTQTGLRPSDLVGLRMRDLHVRRFAKTGREHRWIHYRARKPTGAGMPLEEFDIFCSPLCAKALEAAKELREDWPPHDESDYLFKVEGPYKPLDRGGAQKDGAKPASTAVFSHHYRNLLRDHLAEECSREWNGVPKSRVRKAGHPLEYARLSIPTPTQYRVHLATALYERGVSIDYIRRFLGHLSRAMEAYYVRPKDQTQENTSLAEAKIMDIAGNGTKPLGGKAGEEIRAFLQKEARDRRIDVFENARDLIDQLGPKIEIRGKAGGFCCIRTVGVPCSEDSATNDVLCAYGTCPNLYHFYHMADITYLDFKNTQECFQHNLQNGRVNAARKELNKVKAIGQIRLLPELDELEKTISDIGADVVLSRHPSLEPIVGRIDPIREEVSEWTTKTL